MRLGLFGGTFDPVHYGHLLLAESAREQAELDQVWFVPAAQSPHKPSGPVGGDAQRRDMLELALSGRVDFQICDVELRRGGVSYTVDTLETIAGENPDAELHLLLGGDAIHDLPRWRSPERVCELALPLAARRPHAPDVDFSPLASVASAERIAAMRQRQIEMPQLDLSSREIRRRVAQGRSIRYRTPRAVEVYIATHSLYGP